MATLLSEVEGQPEAYPAVTPFARPAPIGDPDLPEASVNLALAWQRIESWIAHRWTPRTVTWTVEGPGQWAPRLSPFTLATVEVWGGEWIPSTAAPGPLGLCLDDCVYRITGTAGADAGALPEAVAEAVRRLMEFNLEIAESYKGDAAVYETADGERRPAAWAAKAIALSGAADLLRPYRKLA